MLEVILIAPEVAEEVAEGVEEAEPTFEPLILSVGDYLSEVANLFADTLSLSMDVSVFRFFAIFGLFLAAFGLALRLMGAGKTLAR